VTHIDYVYTRADQKQILHSAFSTQRPLKYYVVVIHYSLVSSATKI